MMVELTQGWRVDSLPGIREGDRIEGRMLGGRLD